MSTHEEVMQMRIKRNQTMSVQAIENLLEATRQQIAEQGRVVDGRLLEKERMLEQAVIDSHLDANVTLQDLLTEYKD